MATSRLAFAGCGIVLACAGSAAANGERADRSGGFHGVSPLCTQLDRLVAALTPPPPTLRVSDVRLEAPPLDVPSPALSLRFDLLNESDSRVTDLLIEVTVVERTPTPADPRRSRTIAGPFNLHGQVTVEPGYTMQFDILLKNLAPECDCSATVRVVSAHRLVDLGR